MAQAENDMNQEHHRLMIRSTPPATPVNQKERIESGWPNERCWATRSVNTYNDEGRYFLKAKAYLWLNAEECLN